MNNNYMIILVPLSSNNLYNNLHYNIAYKIDSGGRIVNKSKVEKNE